MLLPPFISKHKSDIIGPQPHGLFVAFFAVGSSVYEWDLVTFSNILVFQDRLDK